MSTDPLPEWVLIERRAIGQRVRSLRKERKLSIDQLASAAFVDRKSVIRTEYGRHGASIDHLLLMARALGVPISQIVRD